jgi:soluble lytic murein transglycosylase
VAVPAFRFAFTVRPVLRIACAALILTAAGFPPALAKSAKTTGKSELAALSVPVPGTKPRRGTPPAKPEQTELPSHRTLLSASDRDLGRKAMTEAEAGRFDAARRIAAQAREPLVGELIRWLWVQTSGSGAGFDDIAAFLASKPDWPARDAMLRRAEENIDISLGDTRILEWFAANPPVTGLGWMRHGEALLRQGRTEEAMVSLRRAWVDGNLAPSDEKSLWVEYGGRFSNADHAARLDRLLWEGNIEAARRMLPRVNAETRQLGEARIALATNRDGADRLAQSLPEHLRSDGGLAYDRLRWQRRRGMDDIVEALLYNAPEDLGRAEKWWVERHFRARKAIAEGRISEAYRLAAGHGLKEGASRAEAEWLAGWIALRLLQEPAAALQHFTALAETVSYPVSVARAAYWLGRTHEALGNAEEARRQYALAAEHSTTFYGQLAAHALNPGEPLFLADPIQPSREEIRKFDSREVVRAARILVELGEESRLRPFILRLVHTATTPEEHKLVAQLARDLRRVDLAVMAAKRSARQNIILLREAYPLVDPMLRTESPETALVLALARQESEFNQFAISSAGARGLMQLMPATAKGVAKTLKVRYQTAKLTDDAAYNVRLGSHYLQDLLRDWDNNYVLALAAYNAGHGRVRRWVQEWGDPRHPSVDVIDWIELIPFSETRNYVQRVLEGVQIYRSLLGQQPVSTERMYVDMRGRPMQVCGLASC